MSARVLSIDEAKQAIKQLQNIINNGFLDHIRQMDIQSKSSQTRTVGVVLWQTSSAATFGPIRIRP